MSKGIYCLQQIGWKLLLHGYLSRYTNIMFIMLCWCSLIGAVSGSSIVKPPTDTTGTIGGTATFVCEVDYGEHIPTITLRFNNRIIYSYLDYQVDYPLGTNKYVVSNTHTNFSLEVRNLNYTDGGNYVCEVIGQKKSAALIVLGSPVVTQESTSIMEGTTANFSCEARFGGPITYKPSIDIYSQIQLVLDDVIYQAQSHIQKESFLKKVYEIWVNDTMDTKALKCQIGTTKSNHLTSSKVLHVHYSVRHISYSPQKTKYEFGSNISCTAKGNPHPLFEWRNRANQEIIIKGQLLNITVDMEGKNSWTCTARNAVGGRMSEDEITVRFEAVPNADGNNPHDEVDYSVRNISYSPQEDKYEFGSNITCSARGNPHPLFEWRNRANPEIIIKGQFLNIADNMEGKNSWTCTARNAVGGRMYEDDIIAEFKAVPNADGNKTQDGVDFKHLCKRLMLYVISINSMIITILHYKG